MSVRDKAPGDLELVRSFVNTNDIDEGIEELATPAQLRDWLAANGLPAGRAPVGEADRQRAIELREALRGLMLANAGEPPDRDPIETFNRVAVALPLSVRLDEDAGPAFEPATEGATAALGALLGIVVRSIADGTWSRMKACREHTCQWAFYDSSRNRSGTWCSMAVCGNRAKARAYRERHSHDE
jgi:predicted RNA-binding Zn ribbon-like protein